MGKSSSGGSYSSGGKVNVNSNNFVPLLGCILLYYIFFEKKRK